MSDTTPVRRYFESARWKANAGRAFLVEERQRLLLQAAEMIRMPRSDLSICDVGCGLGQDLAAWATAGVPERNLAGTELLPERVDKVRGRVPGADIRLVDTYDLPFEDAAFQMCTASLVLSTVTSASARRHLLQEMSRVAKPGGIVAVYDFVIRKPWNRHVRPVSSLELARLWRPPSVTQRAAPLLPVLNLALGGPSWAASRIVAVLPRTHRVWIWTNTNGEQQREVDTTG